MKYFLLKVQRTATKKGLRCCTFIPELGTECYRRFGGSAAGRCIQDYSIA